MTTISFDTHEFVKKLQSVGFTQEQAEVFASEHRRIIEDSLVTKDHLDMRLRELEYRLIIKMGAMMMAAVLSIAALVKFL
ncbi:DUF1640 domain-containing protein [Thiocystis minor]|jgi:hypothetical protein|uniref:DUF1640 domain-containing protein n=1 Tax=Thiocystis minor TaxID=61597 RepID=UPI001913B268|nr:DUF1640 domain-containing protein [Thiocystis minor]MBK5963511.1 DUF1640 domain-containing protein [Thiocystis minor]